MLTRRDLLALAAPAAAALAAPAKKQVALVVTEYRRNSHADVIGTRLLEGYEYYGVRRQPRVHVAGGYADQYPKNDMMRDKAAQHKVPLFKTVAEALTLGGSALAVQGVVLIGEHGTYPYNEKGQHMYPRYELFKQVVDVFERSGRAVPVFCDKHLSYEWEKAKWMYDQSRRLKFPLLAGSSVPISWRRPDLEVPSGARLTHSVAAAHGPVEAYGFHALESLQVMAERRRGSETGVRAVRMLRDRAVWEWTAANSWAKDLLGAAMTVDEPRTAGDVQTNAKKPVLFTVEYSDNTQGAVYLLDGHVKHFNWAGRVEGRTDPMATCMWLQPERFFSHFSALTHYVEELILTRKEPYPVERTLLTTGILAAAMDSGFRKGERIETPHLAIRYKAPKESKYNRGPVPKPEATA
ncbi:MAG: hypothetical protein FJW40_15550 [Acidobacteria bacterium]|nr:hypothetical protein [Acidobacteriota bacterium]